MNLSKYAQRGRTLTFLKTCDIKRSSGSAADYDSPAKIHHDLPCSSAYEVPEEEKEKAGLATASKPLRIYVQAPETGTIRIHDKVLLNGLEYQVVKSTRWPHEAPTMYELFVDYS